MTGLRTTFEALKDEAARQGRTVEFDGARWRVYELAWDPYDRRATPALIFESELAMRRVRTYPANWRELLDADLMRVSWGC